MAVQITEFDYGSSISYICKMLGHPTSPDPAGSTDSAVQQMGVALNAALGELLTMHEWQDLIRVGTISVGADFVGQKEKAFAFPPDFYRFIDQTQWGQQSMLPAMGPVSPQAWMTFTVRTSPAITLYWQVRHDKLMVLNPPFPGPVDFNFMYLSRAQVIDQDDSDLFKNLAVKNGDRFLLDGYMVLLLGRARYLEWKGFDAGAATRDFLAVFNSRAGSEKGAPILSLSRQFGFPYISVQHSLPDTGYGH